MRKTAGTRRVGATRVVPGKQRETATAEAQGVDGAKLRSAVALLECVFGEGGEAVKP